MEIEIDNRRLTFMRCPHSGDVFDVEERTLSYSLFDSVEEAAYYIWNNGARAEFSYSRNIEYQAYTEDFIGELYGEAHGSCVQSIYRVVGEDDPVQRAIYEEIKRLDKEARAA